MDSLNFDEKRGIPVKNGGKIWNCILQFQMLTLSLVELSVVKLKKMIIWLV